MTTRNTSKTAAGRGRKKTTKRKYTKKPKVILELPSGLPITARKVSVADPDALERGELWLAMPDETFVNVATPDITAFDAAIRAFIELPTPDWPFFWRSWILSQGGGKLPLFHMLPEHLPEKLRTQFDELGIKQQEGQSSQTRFLAQQSGPEGGDEDDDEEEPEPIVAKELVGVE